MSYFIGDGLALAVFFLARGVGLDRDRAFYPTVMAVIASYYGLFAIMGGSSRALIVESVFVAGFGLIAMVGFRVNLWYVVGALAAHGGFDFFHGHFIANPGVPAWWPQFCLTYDVTAAGGLAWLLCRAKIRPRLRPFEPEH